MYIVIYFCWTGFVEKEIKKANILTVDTGENPEVPFPRDMIDLEVICYLSLLLKEAKWHHKVFMMPHWAVESHLHFQLMEVFIAFFLQGRQGILIIIVNMPGSYWGN